MTRQTDSLDTQSKMPNATITIIAGLVLVSSATGWAIVHQLSRHRAQAESLLDTVLSVRCADGYNTAQDMLDRDERLQGLSSNLSLGDETRIMRIIEEAWEEGAEVCEDEEVDNIDDPA